MDETVACHQIEGVLENVGSEILKELRLSFGAKNQLKRLQRILLAILSVLANAQRRSAVADEDLRDWLKKLKSAALDADDVVDEVQIEALRRKIPINFFRQVRGLFSPHNPFVFRWKMAYKIKCVRKRLDRIITESIRYYFPEGSLSENLLINRVDSDNNKDVSILPIVGREKDKQNVIHFLVDSDNNKDVSILPIVGVGGIGKTTLVRLIFNDIKIKNDFEICAWVNVSEIFEMKNITKDILESIAQDKFNLSNLQAMQQQLQELLRNRKLLLVLDDVRNEDEAKWKSIKSLFSSVRKGSKILVTTRSAEVARMMGTVAQHYLLKGLSAEHSWALYKHSIFACRTEEETPAMEKIAKEIFSMSGGLPIKVKALGRLLDSRRGEEEWLSIKNTFEYIPILRSSYDCLPSRVKQCFLYCSVFPKTSLLDKERLIKLWIAEGLIPSSDEDEGANPENICDKYLNTLSQTSLFEVGKTDYSDNIVSYKMHDLIHDLACSVAGDESCIVEASSGSEREVSLGCRYMSVVTNNVYKGLTIPEEDYKSVKLRTFLTSKSYFGGIVGVRWGLMSTCLRVLDLSFTSIAKLPDSLGILKHLRFLDLSWTEIRTISDSIISLQKLQTLYLINCYQLQQLPEGIVFLSSLRHLDISGCYKLTHMPRGIGRLTNLRTLPTFIVGKERGRTIMELEHLNQISGKLQIDGLHCVKDVDEAVQANLAGKTELESLDLRWAWSASSESSGDNTNDQGRSEKKNSFLPYIKKFSFLKSEGSMSTTNEDVLEKLQPPNNLKELRIIRYAGTSFPSWMSTKTGLPNLVRIVLFDIKRCVRLPLGHLPSLRLLSLYCMPDLVEWSAEPISTGSGVESIYPRLERLLITNCPKLATLPEGLVNLTALWELQIERCPLLRIQSQRKINGEWRNTSFEEDDSVAQETERSSNREEIEEELLE